MPLSERSRGLVSAQELSLMRPTAYLVNTSRGPIVDEPALVDALKERRIAGAGLDVYDIEPLPLDHVLRTLPNTLLLPHIGYVTNDAYAVFYADAVANILAWVEGTPVARALATKRRASTTATRSPRRRAWLRQCPAPSRPPTNRACRPQLDPGELVGLHHDMTFAELELTGSSLVEQRANGVAFTAVRLSSVDFSGSNLEHLKITDGTLRECNLANVQARRANVTRVAVERSRMTGIAGRGGDAA